MSARTTIRPYAVLSAASMTGNLVSLVTVLQSTSKVTYGVSWAGGGTPVGVFAVQVSVDYSVYPTGAVNNAGTWNTVSSSSITGNSGTGVFDIETGAYATRLIYTATSGTATVTATVNGKVC